MNTQRKAKKRQALFEAQGGKCHWCNGEMILGPYPTEMNRRPAHNLATFEHLDSKISGRRGKFPGEKRITLACYGCNQKRNLEELREHNKRLRHVRIAKTRAAKAVFNAKRTAWEALPWYIKVCRALVGRGFSRK